MTRPVWLSLALLVACGGGAAPEGAGPATPDPAGGGGTSAPSGASLSWSPDSRKVDKVGKEDGAASPDGQKDVVVIAEVQGPATALFVAAVTAKGEPTGDWQADTLIGDAALPIELSLAGPSGKTTTGLFAFENDKLINAPDGSVKLGPGPHKLTLNMADHAAIKDGIRLFVLRADGSIAKSPILR